MQTIKIAPRADRAKHGPKAQFELRIDRQLVSQFSGAPTVLTASLMSDREGLRVGLAIAAKISIVLIHIGADCVEKCVEPNDNVLRWGTEQRLEFIEFKCFWEGGIRRADITDRFNVSVPQASNDLSLYQGLEPENIRYDTRQKRYIPTASFKPRFFKPSAERYLAQLKMIADRVIGIDDTWIGHPPPIDALPIPFRSVRPDVFKSLLGAIRAKQSVEIFYQSMSKSRPDAVWRRVTPRAFGNDGLRWHVRAFCHLDLVYKDFILSRCENVRDHEAGDGLDVPDCEWETFFEVVLRPNPALSASQQRTVALDYAMDNGRAHISVRRALLYYFQKRLRLDIDTDRPAERPVVVENWADFRAAMLEDKKLI